MMLNMYDLKTHKNRQFTVNSRTVVWFFDEEEHDASKLLPDNLFVTDERGNELWNMREAVGREDTCVLLRIEGEKFYFTTFNGFSAWVNVNTLEVSEMKH